MLHRATSRSLVALDELGRGTATGDGAAIAHAVLRHLADTLGCRTLFSTHYHLLAAEHAHHPAVRNFHMGCQVRSCVYLPACLPLLPAAAPDARALLPCSCRVTRTPPYQSVTDHVTDVSASQVRAAAAARAAEVTFLYRLTAGACPKSYGVNVARLAGLPPTVLRMAAAKAAAAERDAGGALRAEELAVLQRVLRVRGSGGGDHDDAHGATALHTLHAHANAL